MSFTLQVSPELQSLDMPIHLALLDYPLRPARNDPNFEISWQEGLEIRRREMAGASAASDPVIAQIRAAFKRGGKDPSRYRPSSEALLRRLLQGGEFPRINPYVDMGNLASLMTGLPFGLYDTSKLTGALNLRLGQAGETYEALGRGAINLEGLFLLTDANGPFGSPYSDSQRTAVDSDCQHLLIVIFGLNIASEIVAHAADLADQIFTHYALDLKARSQDEARPQDRAQQAEKP